MSLFVAMFDYSVLCKYYQNTFAQKKGKYINKFWGLYSFLTVILLAITLHYEQLYFMLTLVIIVITSLYYEEIISTRIFILLVYLLFGIISRCLSTVIMQILLELQVGDASGYQITEMEPLLFSILQYSFITVVCRWRHRQKNIHTPLLDQYNEQTCGVYMGKHENNNLYPKEITICLSITAAGSIAVCCLMKLHNLRSSCGQKNIEFLIFLLILLLICFLLFLLIDKSSLVSKLNFEKKLLLQNMRIEKIYYEDVENNNQQLRKFRHDFNNKLSSFYYMTEKDTEAAKLSIQAMLTELRITDREIKTKNSALNSICSVKFAMAENNGILLEYKIRIPEKISMNYDEMGVLYGNLLDNAIEACGKVEQKDRYLFFATELSEETLIIYIKNSKVQSKFDDGSKKNKKTDHKNHGIGLKSIEEIVNRHQGVLKITQEHQYFIVKIVLYSIKNITQEEEKSIQYPKI